MRDSLSRLLGFGVLTAALAGRLFAAEPLATSDHDARRASPVATPRAWCRNPAAWFREREAVEMLTAIAEGSQMGPGDGWFHPGQSRYGWSWLAQRFDANGDGTISDEEFGAPKDSFDRLDRNGDGELKAEDFDWSETSPFVKQQGQTGQWFSRIDKSSNGRITHEEWQQFFEKLAGEKGYVSSDDLRSGLFPPSPRPNARPSGSQQGPPKEVFIKGVFSGELGSIWEGPGINQKAPDFELETQDGSNKIRLSSFRHQKPVVLVFGSFT
jgi:Ca2+-binding EF-hand superfamily protein